MKPRHVLEIRVRASDTDFMGHVYNARYADWFGVGRAEYLRMCGITVSRNARFFLRDKPLDVAFVVSEYFVKLLAPTYFDDVLELHTYVEELSDKSVIYRHEVYRRSDGKLVAEGYSKHVCVDSERKRAVEIPHEVAEALLGKN